MSQAALQLSSAVDPYSLLQARVSELTGELAVVSAQRMAELAEKERLANRLQHLLDLLPGGVIVIDDRGRVREANPAACELLGLPLETQQRFAGRLKERLHELEHQVRDMLVFARGELPLTDKVSPKVLMQTLQAAAQTHVQGVPIRWQCDAYTGQLLCNRDTLVGALLNLIENALQTGAVQVRVKVHLYRRDNSLRLCVSDSGTGIEPRVLARLGEPFFTTKATGTGLGLAVVNAVVRAHQGQLQLRSRLGRGTCALLSLPLIPGVAEAN